MTVVTASGSKFHIGPAVTTAAADTTAELAALSYVEIKEVETLGEFGDESASVNFAAIGDARVRKAKGARDAGVMALTVGRDPLDAGQVAIDAAEGTNNEYAFKLVANDAPTGLYSDSVYYWRGLVMSQRENYGGNDNIVRKTYNIGINSELFKVPAALLP